MSRTLSVDLLWQLHRLSGLSASPDGQRAVCSVTVPSMEGNQSVAHIWLLHADGRPPRQLTTQGRGHAQAAWSPKGDHVAFLARRPGANGETSGTQLHVIDLAGGEARCVVDLPGGAESFRWMPDGRSFVVAAWVWPGLRGLAAQRKRWQQHAQRKETGYLTGQASYRHWDHLHPEGRVPHLLFVDLQGKRVRDLFEGTAWELPRDSVSADDFAISPDGRSVAFVHDPAAEKMPDNRRAIAEIDLATGRVRPLADDPHWDFDAPSYHPDGCQMALRAAEVGALHTMPARPALLQLEGVSPRKKPRWQPLGRHWDHEAGTSLRWAEGGRSLLFTAEDRGRCHLWRCTPDGSDGRFEVHTEGGWVQGFDLATTAQGEVVFTLQDSHAHPVRAFVRRAGAAPLRIESFNDRLLAGVTPLRTEEVTVQGAQGDAVQMWLTYPPGFDARRRHPVLHVIHGGPFTAAGDSFSYRWNTQVLASRGHVVAQVNFHGSSGFGHAFKHSIMGRLAQLEHQDIEAASDWLLRQRWVDAQRLYASGGSYGGFLVAWLNGHAAPGRYRALVCHAGVFDRVATFAADSFAARRKDLGAWYWDDLAAVQAQSPHAFASRMQVPTLVTHGALDYRVPDCNGLAHYHTLKARGVDAQLLWFPDENHWVLKPRNSRQWYQAFFDWLDRHGKTPRRQVKRAAKD